MTNATLAKIDYWVQHGMVGLMVVALASCLFTGLAAILLLWLLLIPFGVIQAVSSLVLGIRFNDRFRQRYAVFAWCYGVLVLLSITFGFQYEHLLPKGLGIILIIGGWGILPASAAAYYLQYTRADYSNRSHEITMGPRSEDHPDILDI